MAETGLSLQEAINVWKQLTNDDIKRELSWTASEILSRRECARSSDTDYIPLKESNACHEHARGSSRINDPAIDRNTDQNLLRGRSADHNSTARTYARGSSADSETTSGNITYQDNMRDDEHLDSETTNGKSLPSLPGDNLTKSASPGSRNVVCEATEHRVAARESESGSDSPLGKTADRKLEGSTRCESLKRVETVDMCTMEGKVDRESTEDGTLDQEATVGSDSDFEANEGRSTDHGSRKGRHSGHEDEERKDADRIGCMREEEICKLSTSDQELLRPLLESLQSELNVAARRCEVTESTFLLLYSKLNSMPNMLPILEQMQRVILSTSNQRLVRVDDKSEPSLDNDREANNDRAKQLDNENKISSNTADDSSSTLEDLRQKLSNYELNMSAIVMREVKLKTQELERRFDLKLKKLESLEESVKDKLRVTEHHANTLQIALKSALFELSSIKSQLNNTTPPHPSAFSPAQSNSLYSIGTLNQLKTLLPTSTALSLDMSTAMLNSLSACHLPSFEIKPTDHRADIILPAGTTSSYPLHSHLFHSPPLFNPSTPSSSSAPLCCTSSSATSQSALSSFSPTAHANVMLSPSSSDNHRSHEFSRETVDILRRAAGCVGDQEGGGAARLELNAHVKQEERVTSVTPSSLTSPSPLPATLPFSASPLSTKDSSKVNRQQKQRKKTDSCTLVACDSIGANEVGSGPDDERRGLYVSDHLLDLSVKTEDGEGGVVEVVDTGLVSQRIRDILITHNIGQRQFAKHVLGLSQGTVSELLSKPKSWDKLTEKGRDSYRKMKQWAANETNILELKMIVSKPGGSSVSSSAYRHDDSSVTEQRIAAILLQAQAAMHGREIALENCDKIISAAKDGLFSPPPLPSLPTTPPRSTHSSSSQSKPRWHSSIATPPVAPRPSRATSNRMTTDVIQSRRSSPHATPSAPREDTTSRDLVARIYREELLKLSRLAEERGNVTELIGYQQELDRLASSGEGGEGGGEGKGGGKENIKGHGGSTRKERNKKGLQAANRRIADATHFSSHTTDISRLTLPPRFISPPSPTAMTTPPFSPTTTTGRPLSPATAADLPQDLTTSRRKECSRSDCDDCDDNRRGADGRITRDDGCRPSGSRTQSVSSPDSNENEVNCRGELSVTDSVRRLSTGLRRATTGSYDGHFVSGCKSVEGVQVMKGGGTVECGRTSSNSSVDVDDLTPLEQMQFITNSFSSSSSVPPPPGSCLMPTSYTISTASSMGGVSGAVPSRPPLQPITTEQWTRCTDLSTEDLVNKVKEMLSEYSISQRLFGEAVLGLSQGSVSDLLARPKSWALLTQKGREPFVRMQLFLDDPLSVSNLVSTQYRVPADKLLRSNSAGLCTVASSSDCAVPSLPSSAQQQLNGVARKRKSSLDVMGADSSGADDSCSATASSGSHQNKRSRLFFNDDQKDLLRAAYDSEPYPSQAAIDQLAAQLNVGSKTVINWFHNHRMRAKNNRYGGGIGTGGWSPGASSPGGVDGNGVQLMKTEPNEADQSSMSCDSMSADYGRYKPWMSDTSAGGEGEGCGSWKVGGEGDSKWGVVVNVEGRGAFRTVRGASQMQRSDCATNGSEDVEDYGDEKIFVSKDNEASIERCGGLTPSSSTINANAGPEGIGCLVEDLDSGAGVRVLRGGGSVVKGLNKRKRACPQKLRVETDDDSTVPNKTDSDLPEPVKSFENIDAAPAVEVKQRVGEQIETNLSDQPNDDV